jgi:hypothetical protein
MQGVWPPMFLNQGNPFGIGLGFCLGEFEEIPGLFLEEKDFFYWSASVDLLVSLNFILKE